MLDENKIKTIVESHIKDTDRFIVSMRVSAGNKIEVLIDGMSNIGIKDCVSLSRAIEGSLNREEEDFELFISSSGIEEPLVLEKQYLKNIGRNVSIKNIDGSEINALLTGFSNGEVFLEKTSRQAKKIGKGKETVTEIITIPLNQIKETKLVLSFK